MKKLLTILLCVSIISPTFAFAESNKSERKGENNSHKSVQMVQKIEKKEVKKEEKKEIKKAKVRKINYFFCVTATDWKVVPAEALKENNSANYLGEDCVKLPANIAKRLQSILGAGTTTPDIVAPVISLLVASSVAPTSATISWTTNEIANGNIYVSATSPVNLATATTMGTTTLSLAHSFNLSGLSASTTYYYVVKSADVANNTATSIEQSFTTPAVADTAAPIISSIVASSVASTTATVSWNTNELATGKLYYGTSTPLTAFVSTTTLSTAHSFMLTGLTASTTYQLMVESKDAATNTATSTASLPTTI